MSNNPIIPFIEGDGIGGDITRASMRVWNAAVEKAYGGKRKVHWAELFLGEKAAGIYDGDYFPGETLEAVKELMPGFHERGWPSINVGIGGFNSAWSCSRPSPEERGRLWMGANWQVKTFPSPIDSI